VSNTIDHPEMGRLCWEEEWSRWHGQINLPGEVGRLDVIVAPGDGDRMAFLERASELFRWAIASQRRLLHEAIAVEVLELYNDTWRQDAEPKLTAKEMMDRIKWSFLKISKSEDVPVTFGHEMEGDLFGGHAIDVEIDSELQYRGTNLVG
jgi:hypothetical protein